MPTLDQNKDMLWAETMAMRVRKAYIGKHVTRVVGSVSVACALCLGVFTWQPWQHSAVDAAIADEFISVQVEETYSQVYTSPENLDASIFTL